MKNSILILALGLLGVAQLSQAALPPYYESVRRLNATLTNPEVTAILASQGQVSEVIRTDSGYWIKTESCQIFVNVACAAPTGNDPVGPCPLEIKVQSPGCVQ